MEGISNQPYTPDLRGFIEYLDKEHPEEIIRISKEVDPKYGVSGILHRLEKEGTFKAVIFENVKGSDVPLVANMHGSFNRLKYAIGMEEGTEKEFLRAYGALEANPIEPVMVEDAQVHQVVKTGDDINIEELPICTYHELDSGKFITAALGLMRDPDTGIDNIGIYRHQVFNTKELGVQLSETADANVIWKKFEERGEPCPMALVIGHHPAFFLGSLSYTPIDSNELHVAGGILQRPVPLIPCKTIPLDVPADAEIVIECMIRPKERRAEAPFGEFPGTYGPERMNPILDITAITHRKSPMYQNAFVGHADNLLLSGVVRSTAIEETVKIACGTVTGVHMPRSGRFRFTCYVSIDRKIEGEAKAAAMAAFVTDPFLKFCVVVDHDVDITSDTEVMHAIATRVRADRDVFMVPYAKGSPLDPASYDPAGGSHLVTKMGIDATRKDNYPEEIHVPGNEDINLSEFIPGYGKP